MTSVLRDSLGGNCMTSMIATCSVEKKNIDVSIIVFNYFSNQTYLSFFYLFLFTYPDVSLLIYSLCTYTGSKAWKNKVKGFTIYWTMPRFSGD